MTLKEENTRGDLRRSEQEKPNINHPKRFDKRT